MPELSTLYLDPISIQILVVFDAVLLDESLLSYNDRYAQGLPDGNKAKAQLDWERVWRNQSFDHVLHNGRRHVRQPPMSTTICTDMTISDLRDVSLTRSEIRRGAFYHVIGSNSIPTTVIATYRQSFGCSWYSATSSSFYQRFIVCDECLSLLRGRYPHLVKGTVDWWDGEKLPAALLLLSWYVASCDGGSDHFFFF